MASQSNMLGDAPLYAGRVRYRTPGVYYEERTAPHGVRGALLTGVPAFVGLGGILGATGRRDVPFRRISRWEQFDSFFGSSSDTSYLGYAVRGFFENGGEYCIVVPVGEAGHGTAQLTAALTKPFGQGGILEDMEDVDLVCVPDAMLAASRLDEAAVLEIQSAALEHCRRMGDRFAVLDALAGTNVAMASAVPQGGQPNSAAIKHWEDLPPNHGALYFPWIHVSPRRGPRGCAPMASPGAWVRSGMNESTAGNGANVISVPPCGHVAGVYARTDARVGVHKAPANEIVEGALNLAVDLSDQEQAVLNEAGVNCLRNLPGRGIHVMGARTLSEQTDWRYVNVRRLFLTLTRWLERNLDDLVFEPHNPQLWERIRQRVNSYCRDLFDRGALMGRSPDEAFFVKCDAETNPLETRERGLAVAEVGLAAVSPAEFIVVRITQSVSHVAVTGITGSQSRR